MSFLHYMTLCSFKKLNPDWNINLYIPRVPYSGPRTWETGEHQREYVGEDYSSRAHELGVNIIAVDLNDIGVPNDMPETYKSDCLRWHLLSDIGGIWSDMDILFIKPLPAIQLDKRMVQGIARNVDCAICFDEECSYHLIGFYLSAGKNEFFQRVAAEARRAIDLSHYQSAGSRLLQRMFPTIESLCRAFPAMNIANLSGSTVYPHRQWQLEPLFCRYDVSGIREDTIGIHWYNGADISRLFINHFSFESDNTIVRLIREVCVEV